VALALRENKWRREENKRAQNRRNRGGLDTPGHAANLDSVQSNATLWDTNLNSLSTYFQFEIEKGKREQGICALESQG